MRNSPPKNLYRYCFTLVELLVVISVVSILMALLLPAVKQALRSANMISCQNNLKQMTFATMGYVDDWRGIRFPGYGVYNGQSVTYDTALYSGGYIDEEPESTRVDIDGNLYYRWIGVFGCPEWMKILTLDSGGHGTARYACNQVAKYAQHYRWWNGNTAFNLYLRANKINTPSKTIMFEEKTTWNSRRVDYAAPDRGYRWHGTYGDLGNKSWYDGHVDANTYGDIATPPDAPGGDIYYFYSGDAGRYP